MNWLLTSFIRINLFKLALKTFVLARFLYRLTSFPFLAAPRFLLWRQALCEGLLWSWKGLLKNVIESRRSGLCLEGDKLEENELDSGCAWASRQEVSGWSLEEVLEATNGSGSLVSMRNCSLFIEERRGWQEERPDRGEENEKLKSIRRLLEVVVDKLFKERICWTKLEVKRFKVAWMCLQGGILSFRGSEGRISTSHAFFTFIHNSLYLIQFAKKKIRLHYLRCETYDAILLFSLISESPCKGIMPPPLSLPLFQMVMQSRLFICERGLINCCFFSLTVDIMQVHTLLIYTNIYNHLGN